ncbi:Uncharacterized protein family UPF0497, trans-membrane plant [Cynara cardunculus var. scolymus]|uniref:CASP-like protein n=1 Tax=Cynara cardunculus var. scolymus TaxID=59895 RepID=A0A103XMT8_CYNCS|nr:Uncharacterized protein family UPF0497, trans-membrane plant [Cynara cardunculus var. scolymus]
MDIMRVEAFLRVCATLLFITTACLVRLDTQTSLIFTSFSRTATFRDMNALLSTLFTFETRYDDFIQASCLALFLIRSATSAALTASLLALTGEHDLFWMKLCNKFNRFCTQIGGAMLCGYTAFIFMVMVSSLSAFGLFRHYSPRSFLDLK